MPSDAIELRTRAPGAHHDLGQHERPAFVLAANGKQRGTALATGNDPLRRDARERTHDRVEHAVTHHARAAHAAG